MLLSNFRYTGHIVYPLDRRDPDYVDESSIDDQVDIMADAVEEQYRERKIENAGRNEESSQVS